MDGRSTAGISSCKARERPRSSTSKVSMDEPSGGLFTTPEMAAAFSPAAHVRGMLAFEAALARAEARTGVIPLAAANAIAAACRVELVDVAAVYRAAATAGTPAIPLARLLTERVAEDARGYVHWGATSQDAIDTALMLQMREGLGLLEADLLGLCERRARSLAVQLGGAAGTLAALGGAGIRVAGLLGEELGLPLPDLPWHAERDRVATIAATVGVTAGAMAKIAGDITLLAQTEVGEAAEAAAPGKGGSSAMPQKRNPVDAVAALAAARLALGVVPVILAAMAQEHERAAGGWQAEWAALPDLFRYTASAIARVRSAVGGLTVDAGRMRANFECDGGLLMSESLAMALAAHVGRPEAQRIVQDVGRRALAEGLTLAQAAHADARVGAALSPEDIDRALDPAGYLGSADVFIDRALDSYRALHNQPLP